MLGRTIQPPDYDVAVPLVSDLSPQAVLEGCLSVPGLVTRPWKTCRAIDVLYHPGRYTTAAFVLLEDEAVSPDRYWADGQIIYIHHPVRRPISHRGCVVRIAGHEVELYQFPSDRRLRELRRFTGSYDLSAMWAQWTGQDPTRTPLLQRQLLRYVPEKKCVARVKPKADHAGDESLSNGVALRVSSNRLAQQIALGHRHGWACAKASGGVLRLPACVFADTARGVTAIEWVKGQPLVQALASDQADEATAKTVAALRAFHKLTIPGLEQISTGSLFEFSSQAIDELSSAMPALGPMLGELRIKLQEALSQIRPVDPVTIHNDFYFDQVLVRSRGCVIVDLERLSVGDPLIDVANYVVQLRMLAYRPEYGLTPDQVYAGVQLFLNHYQEITNDPRAAHRLRVYSAVALISLARAMLRHLRVGWPAMIYQSAVDATAFMGSPTPQWAEL